MIYNRPYYTEKITMNQFFRSLVKLFHMIITFTFNKCILLTVILLIPLIIDLSIDML